MDDNTIIDMYIARDEDASLYTEIKYGTHLRRFAERLLESSQDADEVVNDALLDTWNAIPPHEPRGYFYTFVARITRFTAINRIRKNHRRLAFVTELTDELAQCLPADGDPEREVIDSEFGRVIDNFLQTLREEQRIMFVRRYWYADCIADIAEKLGCGESRVKVSLMRTRNLLRTYLEDIYD